MSVLSDSPVKTSFPAVQLQRGMTPDYGVIVALMTARMNGREVLAKVAEDPALAALHTQTLNHLRHVGFSFRFDGGAYPHAQVLPGPYPEGSTLAALTKAREFLHVAAVDEIEAACTAHLPRTLQEVQTAQRGLVRAMAKDPMGYYTAFRSRLEKDGDDAAFPEFQDVIDFLLLKISDDQTLSLARSNKYIARLRNIVFHQLQNAGNGYKKAIAAIERGVEFFDIAERALKPETSPPLYHAARYEYYIHYLTAETPGHIFFPTIADLGVTDLLKLRGVPIGLIGVVAETSRADGFYQTPYEFFLHDVNHARRMWQFTEEERARRGIAPLDYYRATNDYLRDVVLPNCVVKKTDDAAARRDKKLAKMIAFEILHEDALPADPAVIRAAFLRPPEALTPFEKIEDDTVVYIMEPGATTLAYVFRKLAHTFYDTPEDRRDYIVEDGTRERAAIADVAKKFFAALGLGPVPAALLEAYAATDKGFPDDFRREVEDDIRARNLAGLDA